MKEKKDENIEKLIKRWIERWKGRKEKEWMRRKVDKKRMERSEKKRKDGKMN